MVFSSLEFLFLFFLLTLTVYYIVPLKARNLVLLLVSLCFYGWGEPVYVFLMIGTILVDYLFGLLIEKNAEKKKAAKWLLAGAVVSNLLILGFFKYYDFFIENLRLIPFLRGLKPLGLSLPIGISFYTFQSLSYVIDVYRKETAAQKDPIAFGAYVTLFPQLIAGPIVRYRDVDDQLISRPHSAVMFASGMRTFIAGLGKKVLFANTAGALWDYFSGLQAANRTVLGAWMGILFYTLQIYFDFSGYSDMAIGLGRMFGFRFLENFNYPYIAKSITDFWRRWHISLSTWFREYVYIPLGGNRKGKLATYRNLLIVWLLTGFWHGASWNFILWGLYYFVILVIEKAFLGKWLEKIPAFFRHLYSLVLIVLGWLLFVSEDFSAGLVYFGNLFGSGVGGLANEAVLYDLLRNLPFFALAVVAATPLPKKLFWQWHEKSKVFRYISVFAGFAVLVVCVAFLVDSTYNPFLYFRF